MKMKFFALAAIIFSSQLHAQDSTKTLDEQVFTASKYPQKKVETGKVISVITREDLEKSSGKTIAEVLNQQVGVSVNGANNNYGTNQIVNIRGGAWGNSLVLVDGLPLNDPSVITNYFDLNLFATENVERIEILKGGQSTLYGSDAVDGVINIITRKAGTKPFSLSTGIVAGSYNTFKEFLNFSRAWKWGSYVVSYTTLNSKGFGAAVDTGSSKNVDNDGFNEHAVNANLNTIFSKTTRMKFNGSYTYYKTDLDAGAFAGDKDYTVKNSNVQAGFGLTHEQAKGSLHFNYLYSYISRNYLDDSSSKGNPYLDYAKSKYIGRSHFAEFYDNWKWNDWQLMLGMDYRSNSTYQEYYSEGPYGPYAPPALTAKMSQTSPYADISWKKDGGWNIDFGARLNIHSVYGSNESFSFNPSYVWKHQLKLFVNLYSAYKVPALYQLFDPTYGNQQLKPERGIIVEEGVELLKVKGFSARAVGFYRNTTNKIDFITTDPVNYISQYVNVSRQTNSGVELEAAYRYQQLDVKANYTYTDGKTVSSYDGAGNPLTKDTTYYNLYHVPRNTFNISVGYSVGKQFLFSASLHAADKRLEYVYGAEPLELKGYYTLDLYGSYRYGKVKFFVDAHNVTNQKYIEINGYNTKQFNLMAGIVFNY